MQNDMSTGLGQSDLTLKYDQNQGLTKSGFKWKDVQVASAEFIGTFFLAFVIAGSKNSAALAPVGIGFGLVALVYCTGPISGGQLNPAVTLGLVVRNQLNWFEAFYCMVSQFLGATFAGLICYALYNDNWDNIGYPAVSEASKRPEAFVGEILQTFALVTVVLNTATTKAQSNNSYFGLAIGFVVLSGALVIGGVSGACFNPAIAMLTVLHGDHNDLWVFFLGPFLGALGAGLVFRITNPTEWDDSDPIARLTNSHHNPDGNMTRTFAMLSQELIGTFFLSWTIALTANAAGASGCIAVGAILTSFVYAGGAISGGHYNPSVTIGVYLRGLMDSPQIMRFADLVAYICVQLLGAALGGSCAVYVNSGRNHIASPAADLEHHTYFAALIAEMLYTFALVLTVLSVGTTPKVSGNSYFGMAIGFTIIAGSVAVGSISGGAFNPAIGIMLPMISGNQTKDIWVYILGDCLGSVLAAGLYGLWYDAFPILEQEAKDRESGNLHSLLKDYEDKI